MKEIAVASATAAERMLSALSAATAVLADAADLLATAEAAVADLRTARGTALTRENRYDFYRVAEHRWANYAVVGRGKYRMSTAQLAAAVEFYGMPLAEGWRIAEGWRAEARRRAAADPEFLPTVEATIRRGLLVGQATRNS